MKPKPAKKQMPRAFVAAVTLTKDGNVLGQPFGHEPTDKKIYQAVAYFPTRKAALAAVREHNRTKL